MNRLMIVIITISIPLGISPCFGDRLEQIAFDSPEIAEYTINILGFFEKAGVAHPGDIIFEFLLKNKKFLDLYNFTQYKFLGRTGEKTFEIEKSEKMYRKGVIIKKLNIYFDKQGGLIELNIFSPVYTGCTENDKIYLKMINLQGNELQYQTILPKCLEGKK